jgi:hypothetical protein
MFLGGWPLLHIFECWGRVLGVSYIVVSYVNIKYLEVVVKYFSLYVVVYYACAFGE